MFKIANHHLVLSHQDSKKFKIMQNRNEIKKTHIHKFTDTQTLFFRQNHSRMNNERREEEEEKKLHLIPDFELVFVYFRFIFSIYLFPSLSKLYTSNIIT